MSQASPKTLKTKILATPLAIQSGISRLMRPGTRRVIVVAFVGTGALAYIPKPKGVTLVCWPKAGGTAPNAVRAFIKSGTNVRFADRLHMKLYWAEGRGAIIGSANLSTNALGSGNLKEIAVLVPDHLVSIDHILKSINTRNVTKDELHKLDKEHAKLGRKFSGKEPPVDFVTWHDSDHRTPWKLGWWDEEIDFAKTSIAKAKREYGHEPVAGICCRKNDYKVSDWVLSFGLRRKWATSPEWVFVNFITRISKSKAEEYPFEAIQAFTNRQRTRPPFTLTVRFRKAFQLACAQYGVKKIKDLKSSVPPAQLLRFLREAMKS